VNPWKATFDYAGNNVSKKDSGAGSPSISVNEYTYDNKLNPSVNMNKYLRIVFGYQDLMGIKQYTYRKDLYE
jgi:hypothetical protein